MTLRAARESDLAAITEIYNSAVLKTTATFDLTPKTMEDQRAWFKEHGEKHPILVAEEGEKIVGFGYLSAWSGRCAYAKTVENTVYINESCRGRGIGKRILLGLLESAKTNGMHAVIAQIAEGNPVSEKLHLSLGYEQVGRLNEVGEKFGKRLDVFIFQKIFSER